MNPGKFKRKVPLLIAILLLSLLGASIVFSGMDVNISRTYYYQKQDGKSNYQQQGNPDFYIPLGCSEKDVKTTTIIYDSLYTSDRLRFEVDDEGNVIQTLNLTEDDRLDSNGANSGISSWGSTDPSGCWHVFQHQVEDRSDLWVVSTSGPEEGLKQITFNGTSFYPNWNQKTGEIIYTSKADGLLYITDMYGNQRKTNIQGDKARFSPDGNQLIFTRMDHVWMLDKNGKQELIGQGDYGIWSPDGNKVFLISGAEINVFDFSMGWEDSQEAQGIAPDPRLEPEYDIIVQANQLMLRYPHQVIINVSGGDNYWSQEDLHIEPEWWVRLSEN